MVSLNSSDRLRISNFLELPSDHSRTLAKRSRVSPDGSRNCGRPYAVWTSAISSKWEVLTEFETLPQAPRTFLEAPCPVSTPMVSSLSLVRLAGTLLLRSTLYERLITRV